MERGYRLRKISAGDWLLLGNDGRTLWRLNRYQDGPTFGLDDWPRDRWFWRTLRWPEPISSDTRLDKFDVSDLGRWHEIASMLATRGAAIEAALDA